MMSFALSAAWSRFAATARDAPMAMALALSTGIHAGLVAAVAATLGGDADNRPLILPVMLVVEEPARSERPAAASNKAETSAMAAGSEKPQRASEAPRPAPPRREPPARPHPLDEPPASDSPDPARVLAATLAPKLSGLPPVPMARPEMMRQTTVFGRGATRSAAPDRLADPVPGNPRPRYPRVARIKGYEGTVLLLAHVTPEGQAERVEIRRTSGHRILDEAAHASVRAWRFVPAEREGRAVSGRVEVPVTFALDD